MPVDPLNPDFNENTPLRHEQAASQLPQIYHKHHTVIQQNHASLTTQLPNPSHDRIRTWQKHSNTESGPAYFDADHRKRRKQTSSPSDSGTEADDEKGGGLLGLPAPPTPTRFRKGLKGAYNSGTASPLLTPSYLDEEPQSFTAKTQPKRRTSLQSQSCTDEETIKLREKFTRRRRAELIRRVSETLLLGTVGVITCRSDVEWLISLYAIRPIDAADATIGFQHAEVLTALLTHAAVVLGLYALYPLRIVFKNNARNASKRKSRFYIHIPAAFEPAPLLYPILIPVFIALSLLKSDMAVLVPNLVLSIASIPSKIFPFSADVPWYNSLQWLLSIMPVLISRKSYHSNFQAQLKGEGDIPIRDGDEVKLLLYPLHQVLLSILGYLTTTSLLPAELNLLSIAIINLLLLSKSPQMLILQSILWIGGLSTFLFCGKVLTWGVALARIPSWRFRKPRVRAREGNPVLLAIDDCAHGRLSKWGWISTFSSDSEDSDSDDFGRRPKSRQHRQMLSADNRRIGPFMAGTIAQAQMVPHIPAIKEVNQSGVHEFNASNNGSYQIAGKTRRRGFTLPSNIGALPDTPLKETLKRTLTTRSHSSNAWSLRSFTKAQAIVIKWLLAIYVYTLVIVVIAFAVRTCVSHNALYGQEPAGWALGYLLGDIPAFRRFTINWNLDSWVHLPAEIPSFSLPKTCSWVQIQACMGSANVRLLICVYCLAVITLGLAVVFRLSAIAEVDTRRKVFHGMMVIMFLPTTFIDPTFISLAFVLILAIFLLLDLFRASQLPPLSKPLTYFLAPYVDGRDHRGPVIVSHIFLLIGCAIPLWLSLAAVERTGEAPWRGWDVQRREVSLISGVVCVGMGDAAASLIGRRYGRRRWCWSGGKSLEGSLAFAVAVVAGLAFARLWLQLGGWNGDSRDSWSTTFGKATIAAVCASLTEAVLTGGNDNVIVPVILWLLVRGLEI